MDIRVIKIKLMDSIKILKGQSWYEDLYDLLTIKECLDYEKFIEKDFTSEYKPKRGKPIKVTFDFFTYYIKGERYGKRSETINEWVRSDREKDYKVENAPIPTNIQCNFCLVEMDMTLKHLYHDDEKVMFWFECPKCKKRKAIFDNGTEYRPEPKLCPKCSSVVKETLKREGEMITTKIICPNCNFRKTEIMDFEKDRKEWEERQRKDQELLEKYRHKFCFTEKEGQEYVYHVESMNNFVNLMKETATKQKDPAYIKARKIKKLRLNQLRKLLEKTLKTEKYDNLLLDKPQIERQVIVSFTVEDIDDKREEYSSTSNCKKLMKKALGNTNWRLMSEGLYYKLGILSGRLKGYESEDDIAELFRKKVKALVLLV